MVIVFDSCVNPIYKNRKLWYNKPIKIFSEKEKIMEKIRIQDDLYTYVNQA